MHPLSQLLAAIQAGDDELAESLASRLGSIPTDDLQTLLRDANPDRRWWGVRLLAESADPQAVSLLAEALADPDPTVGQCAALALRQRPAEAAIPSLIAALASANPLLARLAADALAAIGQPAVPSLLAVLEGSAPVARLEATRALALIADPKAIPALYRLLGEDSQLVEYWANEGLERMGVGMVYFAP
ncbi:MAG: HEAT repeat domain-containing protein [Anaerolineales bacterium]|nr:HEAT repeat domain-containing protein [Anaerolineales bacterium]